MSHRRYTGPKKEIIANHIRDSDDLCTAKTISENLGIKLQTVEKNLEVLIEMGGIGRGRHGDFCFIECPISLSDGHKNISKCRRHQGHKGEHFFEGFDD